MHRSGAIIFNSVHNVMTAEKVLKKAGLDVKITPVPRKLSSDCGLSLRFLVGDLENVRDYLFAANVVPVAYFKEDNGEFEKLT